MGKVNDIERNRPPRVLIVLDQHEKGSYDQGELPFVMGVMADLTGKQSENHPEVGKRKFQNIDIKNFNGVMKEMKPTVSISVENKLTAEGGKLPIHITFEKMEDFSPAGIAKKVEALNYLLEARTFLSNLISFADGKQEAKKEIAKLLTQIRELEQQDNEKTLGSGAVRNNQTEN